MTSEVDLCVVCTKNVNKQLSKHMGKRRSELSSDLRELIIESYRNIKNKSKLSKILGISSTTIVSVIKKFEESGSLEKRSGRGRRRLFTFRNESKLSRVLKQGRHQTLSDVTNFLNEGKDRSFYQKTIERKIRSLGCKWRTAKKKVVVRKVNEKKRVKWCKERRKWTVEEQCKK